MTWVYRAANGCNAFYEHHERDFCAKVWMDALALFSGCVLMDDASECLHPGPSQYVLTRLAQPQ